MGDRTTVMLTVLTDQAKEAMAIFATTDEDYEEDAFSTFTFYDINNGELGCLPALTTAGIAFDSYWDGGSGYGSGTHYGRFTVDGSFIELRIFDSEIDPNIDQLVSRLTQPKKLRQFIVDHVKNTTPLPWDNQEEYGKLYRTKQLINPE